MRVHWDTASGQYRDSPQKSFCDAHFGAVTTVFVSLWSLRSTHPPFYIKLGLRLFTWDVQEVKCFVALLGSRAVFFLLRNAVAFPTGLLHNNNQLIYLKLRVTSEYPSILEEVVALAYLVLEYVTRQDGACEKLRCRSWE